MMCFTLNDFVITVLANQIIGQNTILFCITLRFILDLMYMYLFELSNTNLSSTTLRFISHAFTPRRVEQSTRGLFIEQEMNIRSHTAEFKVLAFSVVLVCCVGIPHPLFVRLVSSDHSLQIPLTIHYQFSTFSIYILLCTSPKIIFNSREFFLEICNAIEVFNETQLFCTSKERAK